jgi:CheY-like chemotaxis protein
MLSHELRNPLAPLCNALSMLRLPASREIDVAAVHEMMQRQVDHLVRLVDDLLEASRISRGTLELRKEPVEIASIVRNAVETASPLIEAAGHELEVSLPDAPVCLDGDPVRLAQILANLLNNAAIYTDRGGSIAICAQLQGSSVEISVRDNGVGIAPQSMAGLFEMFARGDRSSERSQNGLGIGLALARKLAELHGGTLTASSAGLGRGSEFVLRLPLAVNPAQRLLRRAGQPSLQSHRILVVDDNRDAADSLGMLLRALGADVCVVYDGAQALDSFGEFSPSVVLLDVGMPGMDGYQVARRLRETRPQSRASIIALTGWGQDQDRKRAMEAGFDHHLIKPVELAALQKLLARFDGGVSTPRERVDLREPS